MTYASRPQKPGFLRFLQAVTRFLGKKPGFWPPVRKFYSFQGERGYLVDRPPAKITYTTIYNTEIRAKILGAQKNQNRSPLNV